jgi:hypothetical protein
VSEDLHDLYAVYEAELETEITAAGDRYADFGDDPSALGNDDYEPTSMEIAAMEEWKETEIFRRTARVQLGEDHVRAQFALLVAHRRGIDSLGEWTAIEAAVDDAAEAICEFTNEAQRWREDGEVALAGYGKQADILAGCKARLRQQAVSLEHKVARFVIDRRVFRGRKEPQQTRGHTTIARSRPRERRARRLATSSRGSPRKSDDDPPSHSRLAPALERASRRAGGVA